MRNRAVLRTHERLARSHNKARGDDRDQRLAALKVSSELIQILQGVDVPQDDSLRTHERLARSHNKARGDDKDQRLAALKVCLSLRQILNGTELVSGCRALLPQVHTAKTATSQTMAGLQLRRHQVRHEGTQGPFKQDLDSCRSLATPSL